MTGSKPGERLRTILYEYRPPRRIQDVPRDILTKSMKNAGFPDGHEDNLIAFGGDAPFTTGILKAALKEAVKEAGEA